jgi:hypothetical protein
MPLNLLDSFGKKGVSLGLLAKPADVIDTDYLSKYFVVSEFNPKFTAGKNSVSVNGSSFLAPNSEILIECLDSAGHNLYIEMARTSDVAAQVYAYKESTSFVLAIHIFNDTADGIGKLLIYGKLADGRSVKWIRNITVDKTLNNVSKIRFYQRPQLEVQSILLPTLNVGTSQVTSSRFVGSLHGLAVTPPKDTNLPGINLRNVDVDYRLIIDSPVITSFTPEVNSCNSQMIGSVLDVNIQKIQQPFSTQEIQPTNPEASFIISNIYNNKTVQISDPYFYTDTKNNSVITNIVSASFDFTYPFVNYNTTSASYLTTTLGSESVVIRQSYADIVYRNIRTFSGYLARHKIYRKSLVRNADFEIVADEPLFINEVLLDNLTQNKYYEKIGTFYNDYHIEKYWFTSSVSLSFVHSPDKYINSAFITSSVYNQLDGTSYLLVKNDSVGNNRNAEYVPYNEDQFLATSGSSYDSNFISLKANVQYVIQVSTEILKDRLVTNAGLEFYFTSSNADARKELAFTDKHGVRLGTIQANQYGTNLVADNQIFFFTPVNDLYGTLVVVPYRCQAYLKGISFRVYGDSGFSPDVFSTRVPWGVSVANESFEIKSELFDIDHNLVYSDLKILKSFDPSGSSLIPYIPGSGGGFVPGTNDFYVSGSLVVSQSINVQTGVINLVSGSVYIGNMQSRTVVPPSRLVAVRGDIGHSGELSYAPIVDITHNDTSITLILNTGNRTDTAPTSSRRSIAVDYGNGTNFGSGGRKVFYIGDTKTTEVGSSDYS